MLMRQTLDLSKEIERGNTAENAYSSTGPVIIDTENIKNNYNN